MLVVVQGRIFMAIEVLYFRFGRYLLRFWILYLQLTAKNQLRFQTLYANVLKAHMNFVKKKEKRDKKDKKTTTVEASAS